ncbi:MAG: acyl-CoA thioester hydrolase/BAAT C-terminal domain-containing protein [Chthoniobacterales bacterium]
MSFLRHLFLSIFFGLGVTCTALGAGAVNFSFQPTQPLMEDVITIRLTGLNPEEQVQIDAAQKDELGRLWQSSATFLADKKGTVDLSKTAPLRGSYAGIDPMGLFWSMNLNSGEKQRSSFWHTTLTPMEINLTAKRDKGAPITGKVIRRIIKDEIHKIEIRDHGIVANLFLPAGKAPHPGIIVLGGSEGGIPNDAYVAQFANKGYAAFGLAYYRESGLPAHFSNIPLEYFRSAIDALKARPEVDSSNLAMVGSSVGGVAALLCASQYSDIHAVISIIGGPILFQSIDPDPAIKGIQSNFTSAGNPLPFVPVKAPELTPENLNTAYYLRVFLSSLFSTSDSLVEESTIVVEKTNGPILLIGASNDRLFGSAFLNAKAYSRLTVKKFPHFYDIINYDGVGHTLGAAGLPGTPTTINSQIIQPYGIGYEYGGNPIDTARAQTDSWKKIFEFLKRHVAEAKPTMSKS